MAIQITGDAKEISALVLAIQERQCDEAETVTSTDCLGPVTKESACR